MKHCPYSSVQVSSTTPNRFRPSCGGTGIRFFSRFFLLKEEMYSYSFRLFSPEPIGIGDILVQSDVDDARLLLFRSMPMSQSDVLKCLKGTIRIAQIFQQSNDLIVECQGDWREETRSMDKCGTNRAGLTGSSDFADFQTPIIALELQHRVTNLNVVIVQCRLRIDGQHSLATSNTHLKGRWNVFLF